MFNKHGHTGEWLIPICKLAEECILHLFKDCILARMLWYGSPWTIRMEEIEEVNFKDLLKVNTDLLKVNMDASFVTGLAPRGSSKAGI